MDKSALKIQKMFSEIAPKYDQTNTVLSLGIHHRWKKQLVKKSRVKLGDKVLDCATGTGDLAVLFKEAVGSQGEVIGTDFCQEMLDLAPQKAALRKQSIRFEWADACDLPYPENAFDCTSISFGIRNVQNVDMALKNLSRVTRPLGSVMILEFGQIKTPVLKQAFNFYSQTVLPKIGGILSGKPQAYQYLNDSSQEFPSGDEFAKKIMATGAYSCVDFWPLSFGVAYIYRCLPQK